MSKQLEIVTIDGPSGAGKSTVSRMIADRLGFLYLDTGAMYRAVAWGCLQAGIDIGNNNAVGKVIYDMEVVLKPAKALADDIQVYFNSKEISRLVRTPEMGMAASRVSALPVVREKLTMLQQKMGKAGKLVAEGRDTGTVVFPQASWKFYLDAAPEERAGRRYKQLLETGGTAEGKSEILAQIIKRDCDDKQRTIAPLKVAVDAVTIDATELSVDEVVRKMLLVIRG
jgi:cytidylate kinase